MSDVPSWSTRTTLGMILVSLAKQFVRSDERHRFTPKFVDSLLQRRHGALQIVNNAATCRSRTTYRVKTILILSALHRKALGVANNRGNRIELEPGAIQAVNECLASETRGSFLVAREAFRQTATTWHP